MTTWQRWLTTWQAWQHDKHDKDLMTTYDNMMYDKAYDNFMMYVLIPVWPAIQHDNMTTMTTQTIWPAWQHEQHDNVRPTWWHETAFHCSMTTISTAWRTHDGLWQPWQHDSMTTWTGDAAADRDMSQHGGNGNMTTWQHDDDNLWLMFQHDNMTNLWQLMTTYDMFSTWQQLWQHEQ
jgi:hypothetical protein